MRKFLIRAFIVLTIVSVTIFVAIQWIMSGDEFGGSPVSEKSQLLSQSKHFRDGHFHNTEKERDFSILVNIKDAMGDQIRQPPKAFPQVKPTFEPRIKNGLRATWFGHASVLVEIDGYRIFFDPMLSEYAFPVKAVAPKRMNPPPLSLAELPSIDAVFISHDHYDHLDMKTVIRLHQLGASFFVGLGVGSHLEKWNIPKSKIFEMDWGQSISFKNLKINCTEARHYSGRKAMDRSTLWTSWVVEGPQHTVFHSGDSGYSDHFKQIGQNFPNIDLSLIKVGDYGLDLGWQDIHMVPEKSVQAHIDIGAKVMLPIHWGVFELSNHDWDEPIERTVAAAKESHIQLITPKLGESFQMGNKVKISTWWRDLGH